MPCRRNQRQNTQKKQKSRSRTPQKSDKLAQNRTFFGIFTSLNEAELPHCRCHGHGERQQGGKVQPRREEEQERERDSERNLFAPTANGNLGFRTRRYDPVRSLMSDQSYESGLYRPLRMLPERPVDGQRCGSGDGQKGRSRDT